MHSMDIMQPFMAYAGDFERTLADDDWTRLQSLVEHELLELIVAS